MNGYVVKDNIEYAFGIECQQNPVILLCYIGYISLSN